MNVKDNAAHYFVERHAKGAAATKPAFREFGGRALTYGDLGAASDAMVGLYDRHGVRREERALMLVHDTIEFPTIFWGSLKAGVIPVPVNTLLAAPVYDAILRDSRARVLFVSAPLYPAVADILADQPYLEKIFVIGGETPAGALDFAFDQFGIERRDNPQGDVILDFEHVLHRAVILLRPHGMARLTFDQFHRDANPIPCPPYSTLDQIAGAKRARGILHGKISIDRQTRRTRHNRQTAKVLKR